MSLASRVAKALLAMALAISVARPAFADARTEARGYFKRGMEAIRRGQYGLGISELQRAYELLPHPDVLYNIGRAHADAGNLEQAVSFFRRYVETNPPDKDEVEASIATLEARIKSDRAAATAAQAQTGQAEGKAGEGAPSEGEGTTGEVVAPPPAPPKPPAASASLGASRTEDVFAESIVSASKGAQRPLDAPTSTSVITEQDIRLSGITKIPELLRRLAGVDLMQVTGAQTEVSIRGFNQRLANKTLVLVDGRSVYLDLLGATLWQTLSIGVEDIERIEVVRGPSSALYGADAFNGVINIITKAPGAGRSGMAGGYGNQATTHGSLWASGRDGDLSWRLAAGYDYVPRWSREVPNGRADVRTGVADQVESARTIRLDARGSRTFGKAGTLRFGGGLTQGALEFLGVGSLHDIVMPRFVSSDVTSSWSSDAIDARFSWSRLRADSTLNVAYLGQSLSPARAEQNVIDGEIAYKAKFSLGKGVENRLRVGAGYRYKDVSWTYLDVQRREHHYALFLHDELKLAPALSLVGDYRVDWVPYLDRFQQSPRGAVLVHPTPQSTIRGSVATAFRKPSFLESYLRLPIQLPVTGTGQFSEGVRRDDPGFIVNAERMLSAELGYLNHESDYVTFDTALYYNRVSNLIQLAGNRRLTVADFPTAGRQDPSTGLYPVGFGGWENQCQAYNVYGGEAGVRTFPLEGLDLYGNYTLNLLQQDNSACSREELSRIVKDQRTSQHKVNLGVQVRTKPGVDASVDFHYVSQQVWAEQLTNFVRQQIEQQPFTLSDYSLLNARLGYRFLDDRADVALMAHNLLDVRHREHPFGQLVGRRVMVLATYRF